MQQAHMLALTVFQTGSDLAETPLSVPSGRSSL